MTCTGSLKPSAMLATVLLTSYKTPSVRRSSSRRLPDIAFRGRREKRLPLRSPWKDTITARKTQMMSITGKNNVTSEPGVLMDTVLENSDLVDILGVKFNSHNNEETPANFSNHSSRETRCSRVMCTYSRQPSHVPLASTTCLPKK